MTLLTSPPAQSTWQHLPSRPSAHPTARTAEQTLTIALSTGTGCGPTALSAFDAALCAAGVGEYNLVRLSSVIPPHTTLVRVGAEGQRTGRWGDRLFCVYASQLAELAGEQAWAGIGWVRKQDGSGAGLFVEHEGPTESGVLDDIDRSLADMVGRRGGQYSQPELLVSSATCVDEPVCALVVAGFETTGWDRC
jgi:arginine decarboxylase